MHQTDIQGSANPRTPGLVNFVTAVAYHFCLSLPKTFSQPGVRGLADPCTWAMWKDSWRISIPDHFGRRHRQQHGVIPAKSVRAARFLARPVLSQRLGGKRHRLQPRRSPHIQSQVPRAFIAPQLRGAPPAPAAVHLQVRCERRPHGHKL